MHWLAVVILALMATGDRSWPAADCPGIVTDRYEPRTFLGYACEDDCRRHKAGFAWAERHSAVDASSCAVLPVPEAEGCLAYVGEPVSAEQAGYRWALENEIAHQCHCEGAGRHFRAGCRRQLMSPTSTY